MYNKKNNCNRENEAWENIKNCYNNTMEHFGQIRECFSKKICNLCKYCLYRSIVFTIIIFLLLSFTILYFFIFKAPIMISVEPQKFEVKIPAGDSLTQTISIKNLGSSDVHISNISIVPELIENWVNTPRKDFTINSKETENINFSLNISSQVPLGEYRGSIKIIHKNNSIVEIPILLFVQPQARFQATIEAREKVNMSDWFKVKIVIKNVEDSPVYGVKINLNESETTTLNLTEVKGEKTASVISKGTEFITEWWIGANETGWQTIGFDIASNNVEKQTIITKFNVTSGDSEKS